MSWSIAFGSVILAAGLLVYLAVFQQWKPQRLLRGVPPDALLKSRCYFGSRDWFRQGIVFLVGETLVLLDGGDREIHIPVSSLRNVQQDFPMPTQLSERLHGFSFEAKGEHYWFATPAYLLWKPYVLGRPAPRAQGELQGERKQSSGE